jgi:mannose-6-phosphate isomerase-like protein (cupin superfamily)
VHDPLKTFAECENRQVLGFVIAEDAVEARREDGDTAAERITIDGSSGSKRLEQRVIRFAQGRSKPRTLDETQQVLYVATGRGTLLVESHSHDLEPDTGAYVAAGETYEVDNPGPEELVVVAVSLAQENGSAHPPERRTVRHADRPTLPAGSERRFRYLADEEVGSHDVTQFLGVIDPSRAPAHGHVYDEVIYVVEGEGTLHMEGASTPIAPGSCIHLPPRIPHSLENHGPGPMRVLGVFYPAGDPAGRVSEETV